MELKSTAAVREKRQNDGRAVAQSGAPATAGFIRVDGIGMKWRNVVNSVIEMTLHRSHGPLYFFPFLFVSFFISRNSAGGVVMWPVRHLTGRPELIGDWPIEHLAEWAGDLRWDVPPAEDVCG